MHLTFPLQENVYQSSVLQTQLEELLKKKKVTPPPVCRKRNYPATFVTLMFVF